jgi:hypothetical protein
MSGGSSLSLPQSPQSGSGLLVDEESPVGSHDASTNGLPASVKVNSTADARRVRIRGGEQEHRSGVLWCLPYQERYDDGGARRGRFLTDRSFAAAAVTVSVTVLASLRCRSPRPRGRSMSSMSVASGAWLTAKAVDRLAQYKRPSSSRGIGHAGESAVCGAGARAHTAVTWGVEGGRSAGAWSAAGLGAPDSAPAAATRKQQCDIERRARQRGAEQDVGAAWRQRRTPGYECEGYHTLWALQPCNILD